jgi:hypothetical protein
MIEKRKYKEELPAKKISQKILALNQFGSYLTSMGKNTVNLT